MYVLFFHILSGELKVDKNGNWKKNYSENQSHMKYRTCGFDYVIN